MIKQAGTYEEVDNSLSYEKIEEMEEKRVKMLAEAGINELQVLADAKRNFNIWENYFNENNVRGKDDMNFALRDQWTAIERSEFTRLMKPAMTFNKLYDPVKKMVGEQRKNKPDLQVRSLTGHASQDQIDLRADLLRTIAYQSQNDLIYQTAFKSALLRGWGAFQIGIDYESPRSFRRKIVYSLIPDVTRCYFDPAAILPHKGDGNYCGRTYLFSREEFNATFPYVVNPVSYTDSRTLLDFQWETRDSVVVADYFSKDWYPLKILELSNGLSVTEDEWEKLQEQFALRKELARDAIVVGNMILDEIPRVISDRLTQDYDVRHYRLTKNMIIDFTIWPSPYLPIIFVDGDSHFIDGCQYTHSLIHDARDAQKFLNYVNSEAAADLKNRRREQWLATADNILGQEQQWRNPELQQGALIAKPDPKTGQMPVKMAAWEISQGFISQAQRATMDIKEILGYNDANLGIQDNAISGKAVRQRQMAGGMSDYVFRDNLNQATEQGGRVVLSLLPVVYHEKNRPIIVTKSDGRTQSLVLNEVMPDGTIRNELSKGDFDIEISAGPSFAVQRETSLELLLELCQVNPNVFPLVADYIAKNLDVQFMPQIAERFKTLVPAEILAKEEGTPPPPPQPPPPEVQLQMQQMQMEAKQLELQQQQHEIKKAELMMKAQELQDKLQTSHFGKQAEIHKSNVEAQKADLDYTAKLAKIMADIHTVKHQVNADLHKHFNPQTALKNPS